MNDTRMYCLAYYGIFFISIVLLSGLVSAVSYNDPSAYWKFNEASGNATDSSGNGLTLTISAHGNYTSGGKLNNAALLKGGGGKDSFSRAPSGSFAFQNNTFTIAVWYNVSGNSSNSEAFGLSQNTGSWKIVHVGDGSLTFVEGSVSRLATNNVENSSWHRIVWVRESQNSTGFKLYVDGVLSNTASLTTNISDTTSALNISTSNIATNVTIDDLRIYNGYGWSSADVSDDWNSGNGREFDSFQVTTSLITPANSLSTIQTNLTFNATAVIIGANLTNMSLYIWNSTTTIYNITKNNVNGTSNSSIFSVGGFSPGLYLWNVYSCGKNSTTSTCSFALSNYSFTISGSTLSSTIFNTSSFETMYEAFSSNLTTIPSLTVSSARLFYNNAPYSGSVYNAGSNVYTLSTAFDLPANGAQNYSWFWTVTYNNSVQENLTTFNQFAEAINLSICNAALTVNYINFSFKDEGNLSNLNATLDASTWNYYVGSGTVNKSYTFSNATINQNYQFCFSPSSKTLFTSLNFKYASPSYPQRTYSPSLLTLTNTTTNQILYLLNTANGVYSSIQIVDSVTLQPVSGAVVTIERTIGSSFVTIESGTSDSSGLVTFWVNPNFDHRITASAVGYTQSQVTIRPSQSTYTLTLSRTSASASSYTSDLRGIRWFVSPRIGSLKAGTHTFMLNVSAANSNLENCKFELRNAATNASIAVVTGINNASFCSLGYSYAIPAGTRVFGITSIDTTNTTGFVVIDADAKWIGVDLNITWSNTIIGVIDDLVDFSDFGSDSVKIEFSKFVLFFFLGTIGLALISFFTGWEINNPSAGIVIVWIMVLIASFAGVFAFDYGSENLSPFVERHGVALIYTMFAVGFILNNYWRSAE